MTVPDSIQAVYKFLQSVYGDKLYTAEMAEQIVRDISYEHFVVRQFYTPEQWQSSMEQYVQMAARCRLMAEYLEVINDPGKHPPRLPPA